MAMNLFKARKLLKQGELLHRPNAVINGKTNAVECLKCGASEKLVLPATIEEFTAQGMAFGKKHEAC